MRRPPLRQTALPIVRLEFLTGGFNVDWVEFVPVIESFAGYMGNYPGLGGADAMPAADPDHDGIPNVLEQWFELAPNSYNRAGDHIRVVAESGNLFFQVTYKDSFRDSILTIQESEDLVTWRDLTLNSGWVSDAANTRTIKVPLLESVPKKFSRVKVSY